MIPLARLTFNKALDTSFHGTGEYLLPVPGVNGSIQITAMAFERDSSKIVLAGTAKVNGINEFLLVRLNATVDQADNYDTIDPTFGVNNNGVVLLPIGSDAIASSLVIDPASNEIFVAGTTTAADSEFALAAFYANGAVDKFSVPRAPASSPPRSGAATTRPTVSRSSPTARSSWRVRPRSTVPPRRRHPRYNISGSLDTTFGPSPGLSPGLVTTNLSGDGESEFDAVAVEPDYDIVAAGAMQSSNFDDSVTAVARYSGIVVRRCRRSPGPVRPQSRTARRSP